MSDKRTEISKLSEMSEYEVMARTIYGEARGEYARIDGGLAALIAVGNVILNRVHSRTWFGLTVQAVCLKPYQFSCWNVGDVNRLKLIQVPESDALYALCLMVAKGLVNGQIPDLTKGADHYYANHIQPPKWAINADERLRIGAHRFFKVPGR